MPLPFCPCYTFCVYVSVISLNDMTSGGGNIWHLAWQCREHLPHRGKNISVLFGKKKRRKHGQAGMATQEWSG